jgi:ketosteroid isomerase-like protein
MNCAEAVARLLDDLHAAQSAFYAGGGDGHLRDLLSPDITRTVPGDNAIAGVYSGIDAVCEYFRRRRRLAAGTFPDRRLLAAAARSECVRRHVDGVSNSASGWLTRCSAEHSQPLLEG